MRVTAHLSRHYYTLFFYSFKRRLILSFLLCFIVASAYNIGPATRVNQGFFKLPSFFTGIKFSNHIRELQDPPTNPDVADGKEPEKPEGSVTHSRLGAAASGNSAIYFLSGLDTQDYPWSCKCNDQELTEITRNSEGKPKWVFSEMSSVGCVGTIVSLGDKHKRGPFCDPSNNSLINNLNYVVLLGVTLIAVNF